MNSNLSKFVKRKLNFQSQFQLIQTSFKSLHYILFFEKLLLQTEKSPTNQSCNQFKLVQTSLTTVTQYIHIIHFQKKKT